jgi:hypothetical protein
VKCISASGQGLEIAGEVKIRVKLYAFSWTWVFLVSRVLCGPPILGADFIASTRLIPELGRKRCYFAFAPAVGINFIQNQQPSSCLQTQAILPGLGKVQLEELTPTQKDKLEGVVKQYTDVLNKNLGLTHLLEYEIQSEDSTPVRSAPYRLAPPTQNADFEGAR